MSGLVIDDGIKESDYGYVLRVSGPRECGSVCKPERERSKRGALSCVVDSCALRSDHSSLIAVGSGAEVWSRC